MRVFFSVVVLLLVSACATQKPQNLYQGDDSFAAMIKSSATVLVKYIDNDEVNSGFIGQEPVYRVAAGQRTVMVEYSDLFEISNDEHEKVVSRPAKITFMAEPGKTYLLMNAPQKGLESARTFAEKPEFTVMDAKSGQVVAATVELSRPRTFMTSLRSAVAPVYEFESDLVPEAASQTVLENLQTLWGSASEADRDAFLQWLNKK